MEKAELNNLLDDLAAAHGYPRHVTSENFQKFRDAYFHAVGHYRAALIPEAMRILSRNPRITRFPAPGEVYQAFRDAAESAPAAVDVSVDTDNVGAVRDMIADLKKSIRG